MGVAIAWTRPLGASLGDGFSQAHSDGGPGLGATATSVIFLATILVLVAFLAITRRDQTPPDLVAVDAGPAAQARLH